MTNLNNELRHIGAAPVDAIVRHLSADVTVVLGDCLTVDLPKADAVISDPPYGMNWKFTGQGSGKNAQGSNNSVTKGERIIIICLMMRSNHFWSLEKNRDDYGRVRRARSYFKL